MNTQKIKSAIAALICISGLGIGLNSASAQDFQRYQPKRPTWQQPASRSSAQDTYQGAQQYHTPYQAADSKDMNQKGGYARLNDPVLARTLNGLVFSRQGLTVSRQTQAATRGVRVMELPILEDTNFVKLVKPFLGQPITVGTINDVKAAVAKFYRSKGRPVVTSYVPEQEITNGVVNFVVVEARLGQIRVENDRTSSYEPEGGWFNEENILRSISAQPGEPIDQQSLLEDVAWMNRNQFRSVDVLYEPGRAPYTTDVVLKVNDVFPFRPFIGFENTGNAQLGEGRFFAGFNAGNLWNRDHTFDYQFTTKSDFKVGEFMSHTFVYTAPLAKFHTLKLFGAVGRTDADLENGLFNVNSDSYLASLRYVYDIRPRIGNFTHRVEAGFDFKEYGSTLEFDGKVVNRQYPGENFQVGQFVLGYNGDIMDKYGSTHYGITGRFSPGGMVPNNKQKYLADIGSPLAEVDYGTVTFSLDRLTRLPAGMSLLLRGSYQLATTAVPPSEQFGIGGFGTVRGFDERGASGDEGYNFTAELRSPVFTPAKWLGAKDLNDALMFVGFYDLAGVNKKKTLPGEDKSLSIDSIGAGVRYNISGYLSSRFDYGHQLTALPGTKRGDGSSYSVTLSWIF